MRSFISPTSHLSMVSGIRISWFIIWSLWLPILAVWYITLNHPLVSTFPCRVMSSMFTLFGFQGKSLLRYTKVNFIRSCYMGFLTLTIIIYSVVVISITYLSVLMYFLHFMRPFNINTIHLHLDLKHQCVCWFYQQGSFIFSHNNSLPIGDIYFSRWCYNRHITPESIIFVIYRDCDLLVRYSCINTSSTSCTKCIASIF